jgi:hypothetical protein
MNLRWFIDYDGEKKLQYQVERISGFDERGVSILEHIWVDVPTIDYHVEKDLENSKRKKNK